MQRFLDYLGQEVHVGDTVIYPTSSGSSSASMNKGIILAIDPLVRDGDRAAYRYSQRFKPPHGRGMYRWPIVWDKDAKDWIDDNERAYVVQVKKHPDRWSREPKKVWLKNVQEMTVVTLIADDHGP